jgi:hypothetical protein
MSRARGEDYLCAGAPPAKKGTSVYHYLFGSPMTPRRPSRVTRANWLVLGAYPSALHVRWLPPVGRPISAVAVADEPEPFWEGADQDDRIDRWKEALPWDPTWGQVASPGRLNGFSGVWLKDQVLDALRISRSHVWPTDCLDTYHESAGAARRLDEPSLREELSRLGIPDRRLPKHPSELEIVREAQVDRVKEELLICRPARVITLGNAALRVFARLLVDPPLRRLVPDSEYGRPHLVRMGWGDSVEWIPLVHPGAPRRYQEAHARWRLARRERPSERIDP